MCGAIPPLPHMSPLHAAETQHYFYFALHKEKFKERESLLNTHKNYSHEVLCIKACQKVLYH
jgi:hypothetical protein